MRCTLRPGQSLIELLLAVAIFVISLTTIGVYLFSAIQTSLRSSTEANAREYAIEGLEATRAIRDVNFSNVTAGTHGLTNASGTWAFSGTSDVFNDFTRSVVVSALDAHTRAVTSTVTWVANNQTQTTSVFTLLTDWTVATAAAGTWSNPIVTATTTIPGSIPALALALDTSRNLLYVTTPQSATGPEFWIYDVTDSQHPAVLGSLEIGRNVYTVAATGTRAYLSASTNPAEIRIIDTTNPSAPVDVGHIKLNSNVNVNAIAIDRNGYVHLVRDRAGHNDSYQIWDATNPAHPVQLGGIYLGDGANDIALTPDPNVEIGGHLPIWAYIASKNNLQEMQDVNFTDPASMGVGGSYNIAGVEDFHGIAVSGTEAYAGSRHRLTGGEFFVFNTADPTSLSLLSSFPIGADVNRVRTRQTIDSVTAVQNNLVWLATASSSAEFIVMNVSNPAAPTIFGSLPLPGVATDIALTTSTAYVTTDNPGAGLMIIGQAP